MPSTAAEPVSSEAERAELRAVLESPLFARSPTLSHLLSYLCEKSLTGETAHIKEYSIALEVFGRRESFDQDTDSIVRVEANRLRKRLAEYYRGEGTTHALRINIPVGQYVPIFENVTAPEPGLGAATQEAGIVETGTGRASALRWGKRLLLIGLGALILAGVGIVIGRSRLQIPLATAPRPQQSLPESVGPPAGDEVRILAGSRRSYVDHAGKLWSADAYFSGGTPVRSSIQHIWRTQDAAIYRTSRQGDFTYNIPLRPGRYELHLHFAEMFYGPEDMGGGEGSRVMNLTANGKTLLTDFDVLADSGGGRTADVKVFTDVIPARDGLLHLACSSTKGGTAMLSAIEVLPGTPGRVRPVRLLARDTPYYSNDSRWWSPDTYFQGGQLAFSEQPAVGTDDTEFYETERWGHFSYAIPVAPGKYTLRLHFIERRFHRTAQASASAAAVSESPSGTRTFNVYCNGRVILRDLNILQSIGADRPLVRTITGLEPNAQGKLLLEFVPTSYYATVTAIEVLPQ